MSGERRLSVLAKAYLGMVGFSLLGSLASGLFQVDPGPIRPLAGLITLGLGFLTLLAPLGAAWGWKRAITIASGILAIGASSELIGLYTGLPFGRYEYTSEWWPLAPLPDGKLFPLQLPFAWFMMAAGGYFLFAKQISALVAVPLGAVVATLVNLPMEWAMLRALGYWRWTDPSWPIGDVGFGVPWMNSVGWLVTAWIAGAALNRAGGGEVEAEQEAKAVLFGNLGLMVGLGLISTVLGTPSPLAR